MTTPLLTYAGHSAWFMTLPSGFTLAIDPWLDGNPLCPPSLKHPARLDLICLTHGHADHAGDAVRLHRLTKAKVCATWELCSILTGEGVD
jgi:L-ascorbate metabolism protein UlaG (beta-lactamase superfamily)